MSLETLERNSMGDSILLTIKKLLGIGDDYEYFDEDIIIHINSVLMILNQLGIGPVTGFSISDESATWSDFVDNLSMLEAVRSYVYIKVRLLFDPPTSSFTITALENQIKELEWRLNVMAESKL